MISIYIPRIDAAVTIEQIKNILENVFNLGTIQRIECKSNRRYKDFFCCFVFFNQWNVNCHADYFDLKNISELSFYRDPIQTIQKDIKSINFQFIIRYSNTRIIRIQIIAVSCTTIYNQKNNFFTASLHIS